MVKRTRVALFGIDYRKKIGTSGGSDGRKDESKKSLMFSWDDVSDWFYGGQGQNRTADTGIFRASKINNVLIMLEQGVFGTISGNCVDSIG